MIEWIMFFSLGFLSAGLLTLLFLPLFWRRAVRLSTRRLEMRMPLSMTEIVAERDQLRAEFATDRRRLEQKAEAILQDRARDLAELGRRASRLAELTVLSGEQTRELNGMREDIVQHIRARHEAEGERGAMLVELHDASGLIARRDAALLASGEERRRLVETVDENRGTIAALGTRASALEARAEDLQRALKVAQIGLIRAHQEHDDVTARTEAAMGEVARLRAEIETLKTQPPVEVASPSALTSAEMALLRATVSDVAARMATLAAARDPHSPIAALVEAGEGGREPSLSVQPSLAARIRAMAEPVGGRA